MRVGIIGCGLIGQKRAKALGQATLVAVVDSNDSKAQLLASRFPDCLVHRDELQLVKREDIDLIIVSTTNDVLAPVTLLALQHGKHVLVEKPAGRSAAELRPVFQAEQSRKQCVKVGFNKRFHPAFLKARELVDSGAIGPIMYVRARYGHGGRIGYDREWRADPTIAGGGELLDQGVHLIDLARWFLGDFSEVSGHTATYFWDMPVEDNAFLQLKTPTGQVAWLHASCTEWKNLFSFEIFGKTGKLQIDGLGGSYGVERLAFYRMLPKLGPPETTIWEYPGEDTSWSAEFQHMLKCIELKKIPSGSLADAVSALEVVRETYARSSPTN